MAYFHVNDPNQTPINQICVFNEPYISGLEVGQVLVHLDPAFMQKDNGLMVGVDHRFTSFYVINQDHLIIDKLNITWNNCLITKSDSVQTKIIEEEVRIPVFWFSFISVFMIMMMIKRVIRCKRY
ncbi:MAG TPA: hypothetical protein DIC19_03545 [Erysipelotrichaceae bacterium]|nr:hypothetical protein [Erysipelotrichaceae bacterium]